MESVAANAVGQGGFMTALGERVSSDEAFILIVLAFIMVFIALVGFALWKVWGEFKQMIKDREHTGEKRTAEHNLLQNEVTELRGMVTSHFQMHLEVDKKLDEIKELKESFGGFKERFARIETKLDILLERRIGKPKLPE